MTLSTSIGFERSPLRGATLDDLDQASLTTYIEGRMSPRLRERFSWEASLERLGLVGRSGPNLLPTVAGMLLFGNCPQLIHPEWGLGVLRVHGMVLSDKIANREDIEGNLEEMLEQGLTSIEENTRSLPDQVEPGETAEEYALSAVREALVNALVHRDWNLPGRIVVRIYDDRLELWSPGGPLPIHSTTLEDLSGEGGVSMPRNPIIAATCRFLGMGEQVGRGLPSIRRAVSEHAGHPLAIVEDKASVCVVVPSALHVRQRTS